MYGKGWKPMSGGMAPGFFVSDVAGERRERWLKASLEAKDFNDNWAQSVRQWQAERKAIREAAAKEAKGKS